MRVAKVYVEYTNMAIDQPFHYACQQSSVQRGMRVQVPFSNRNIIGFVYEVMEMSEDEIESLDYPLQPIMNVLDEQPLMDDELFSLAHYMSKKYVASFISCCQVMLPNKLKPKSTHQAIKKEMWIIYVQDVTLRGAKQKEALDYIKVHKEMARSKFNVKYGGQLAMLVKLKAVCLEERECIFQEESTYIDQSFSLTTQQQSALTQMRKSMGHEVFLLHGATGSGKSEVFLQMAQDTIDQGKQVLILVPEIALTPQMVKRVKARFHERVAIYHSSLNNQEKYEQYKLVKEKQVQIVVGTRSAVFMPFQNLGLLILDEEHDQSYKQDSAPRYHTRDVAIFRAKHHHCKVLLASATPSLESYARAIKDVYALIEMPHRIYGDLPKTKLIDMKEAMRHGEHYILSNTLKEAIKERLQKKEQVILLLNRRGYAPILRCMDCGDVRACPHCDLTLNYHKKENLLKCHVCGYSEPNTYACPKCGGVHKKYMGLGTQKLEEYIKECFPDSNVIRMDADTTNRKNAHEQLLQKFEQTGDILLGTQMIAKGLDFERVTLVGILNGDALLNRSDYRSVELTFDLLMQASGRSGRGVKDGEVFIQVYDQHHYAITCAKEHHYQQFFYQEMKFRHVGNYPPYSYLGSVVLLDRQEDLLMDEAQHLKTVIQEKGLYCLGPIALLKIKDLYRVRIIVKSKNEDAISTVLYEMYKEHVKQKGKAQLEVDVNPYLLD